MLAESFSCSSSYPLTTLLQKSRSKVHLPLEEMFGNPVISPHFFWNKEKKFRSIRRTKLISLYSQTCHPLVWRIKSYSRAQPQCQGTNLPVATLCLIKLLSFLQDQGLEPRPAHPTGPHGTTECRQTEPHSSGDAPKCPGRLELFFFFFLMQQLTLQSEETSHPNETLEESCWAWP